MLLLKALWRWRECESDFPFQLDFRIPACQGVSAVTAVTALAWAGKCLTLCVLLLKNGTRHSRSAKTDLLLHSEEEKTALQIIDKTLHTRAISSESFPPLRCLNQLWRCEGGWMLLCAQKPSFPGKIRKSSPKCWFNETSNTAVVIYC